MERVCGGPRRCGRSSAFLAGGEGDVHAVRASGDKRGHRLGFDVVRIAVGCERVSQLRTAFGGQRSLRGNHRDAVVRRFESPLLGILDVDGHERIDLARRGERDIHRRLHGGSHGFDDDPFVADLIHPTRAAEIHHVCRRDRQHTPCLIAASGESNEDPDALGAQEVQARAMHGHQSVHVRVTQHDVRGEHAGRIGRRSERRDGGIGDAAGEQDLPVRTVDVHFLFTGDDMSRMIREVRQGLALAVPLRGRCLPSSDCQERLFVQFVAIQRGSLGQDGRVVGKLDLGGVGEVDEVEVKPVEDVLDFLDRGGADVAHFIAVVGVEMVEDRPLQAFAKRSWLGKQACHAEFELVRASASPVRIGESHGLFASPGRAPVEVESVCEPCGRALGNHHRERR